MNYLLPEELTDSARDVIEQNSPLKRTICVAESCTGGLVSAALTEIAGSSDVFQRSYITYSNAAKQEDLKVSRDIIDTFGAVSIAVAWAMARGALEQSGADVAVAITGVAGPGGGTEKKTGGHRGFCLCQKRRGSRAGCCRTQAIWIG